MDRHCHLSGMIIIDNASHTNSKQSCDWIDGESRDIEQERDGSEKARMPLMLVQQLDGEFPARRMLERQHGRCY